MQHSSLPFVSTACARTLRRLARKALVLFALAPALLAQTVKFEPQRHLEGYGKVLLSEFRDLYRLADFERYTGHVLVDERLTELRQAWRAERERVAAQVDHFTREPSAYVLYRLERDMLVHPYFSRVRTKTFASHDPFVFLVQAPRTSRRGYEEEIVDGYGASLLELERLFERELVEPLGLTRRPGYEAQPIIVLAEENEYARYLRTLEGPALFFSQAHYDPVLRAVVTFVDSNRVDSNGSALGDPTARRPVVHEAVHALRDAHAAAPERRPELWLDEGLASYYSARVLTEQEVLGRPADVLAVKAALEVASDPERIVSCFLDVDELSGIRTYGQVYEHMQRKALSDGGSQPDYPTALLALFGQAGVWVWYLNEGAEGGLQDGFRNYVKLSLEDRGGSDALRRSFEGMTLEGLNAGFHSFLSGSLEEWGAEGDGADLEAFFRLSDATESSLREEADVRVNTLEALAPVRSEPEVRFATALRSAREGRFMAAAQEVQLILAYRSEGELARRAQRELERLNGFRDLRRRFLERLADSDNKLNLMIGERRLLAEVVALEDTRVVLGENRLEMEELELDAIDPLQLVKLMRTSKYGFEKHWLQAYPHVLLENKEAERFLRGESSEAALALLEDQASGDIAEWLRFSEAVETLAALSDGGMPDSVREGRTALALVRRLQTEFSDLELVGVRRQPIIQIAHRAQSLLFEEDGLSEVIHGQVEDLGDGRVRIAYDFIEAEEADDFTPISYLEGQRWQGSPTLESSQEFEVMNGALTGSGAICSRHVLEFEGPQAIRMRYLFRTPQGAFDERIRATIGLCDDGQESNIICDMLGGLDVTERSKSYHEEVPSSMQVYLDTEHVIEVFHDGADRVETTFDGQPAAQASCGGRLGGFVFLWLNSGCPFEVVELSIEGRISPTSLRTMRQEWVLAKLSEIGLR